MVKQAVPLHPVEADDAHAAACGGPTREWMSLEGSCSPRRPNAEAGLLAGPMLEQSVPEALPHLDWSS